MSLLDRLKRKKTRHVREELWDAPTLFGGVGSDSPDAEKKISVLSAAGGKPGKRAKSRRMPDKSGPMIRPSYVVLLIGTLVLAGVWQSGVLDRNVTVAVMAKLDALIQAGLSVLEPSGEPASTHAVRAQASMAILPEATETASQDGRPSGQAALIERVAFSNTAESRAANQPASSVGALEAALNAASPSPDTAQHRAEILPETKKPTATSAVASPSSKPSESKVVRSKTRAPATQASSPSRKDSVAPEKTPDRKVHVAKSKEPDADAQLLEALLVHLRKTESAKGGSR